MPSSNPESLAAETLETVQQTCSDCCEELSGRIRQAPLASVLAAAGIGYVLCLLPLASIAGALGRLLLALAKPGLVILGILSLAKLCPCCKRKASAPTSEESEPLVDSPAGPA